MKAQWGADIAWEVAARFLWHLIFLPVLSFVAYMLVTPLVFLPGEHPFHTDGASDYEKFPRTYGLYMATPVAFLSGGSAGWMFSKNADRAIRNACLAFYGLVVGVLSVWYGSRSFAEPWPAWMHCPCAYAAANAVCRYWPLPKPLPLTRPAPR